MSWVQSFRRMADLLNDKLILSHTELGEDLGFKLKDKVVLNVARSYLNQQSLLTTKRQEKVNKL